MDLETIEEQREDDTEAQKMDNKDIQLVFTILKWIYRRYVESHGLSLINSLILSPSYTVNTFKGCANSSFLKKYANFFPFNILLSFCSARFINCNAQKQIQNIT